MRQIEIGEALGMKTSSNANSLNCTASSIRNGKAPGQRPEQGRRVSRVFFGKLQERYGINKENAELQVEEFERSLHLPTPTHGLLRELSKERDRRRIVGVVGRLSARCIPIFPRSA